MTSTSYDNINRKLARQLISGQNLTLIHVRYCPFCIKTDLAAGYLNINKENIACGDSTVTVPLIGKHQVPILKKADSAMAESDDICEYLHELSEKRLFLDREHWSANDLETVLNILGQIRSLSLTKIRSYMLEHPVHSKDFCTEEARNIYKSRYPTNSPETFDDKMVQQLFYQLDPLFVGKTECTVSQFSRHDTMIFSRLRTLMILHQVDILAGPSTVEFYKKISDLGEVPSY